MKWTLNLSTEPVDYEYPVEAIEVLNNGMTRKRYLRVEDVIESLEAIIRAQDSFFELPLLPKRCIHFTQTKSGRCTQLLVEIEKAIFPIRYSVKRDELETYFIGFPRLLVCFKLFQDEHTGVYRLNGQGTKLFALEENAEINEDTSLYCFPFPNVYTDGHICWGMNQLPTFPSLVALEKFMSIFTSAPFNEDLGLKVLNGMNKFKQYIEAFEDQPFDDVLLMPANLTIQELMERTIKGEMNNV